MREKYQSLLFKGKELGKSGFTLTELLIVIAIFLLIAGAIFAIHNLSQRAYRESEIAAEISQNGRVVLERMVREIRQAKEIVTELPDTQSEATSTILFQDGHDPSYIHYIHYFLDNTQKTIKREEIAYYFSSSGDPDKPSTYVVWNATPPSGETLETKILKGPEIIGEYIADLDFWQKGTINIFITLERSGKTLNLRTKVFGRNL